MDEPTENSGSDKDPRTSCKYGSKCYQKNSTHQKKYKHPPKRTTRENDGSCESQSKRQKLDDDGESTRDDVKHRDLDEPQAKAQHEDGANFEKKIPLNENISNDISDSDEEKEIPVARINKTTHIGNRNEDNNSTDSNDKNATRQTTCIDLSDSGDDTEAVQITGNSDEDRYCNDNFKTDPKISNDISDSDDDTSKIEEPANLETIISAKPTQLNPDTCEELKEQTKATSSKVDQGNSEQTKTIVLDKKEFIKSKFLVDMPQDFYDFWNFCKKLNAKDTLACLRLVGLTLVGPFDVLADRFNDIPEKQAEEYLLHWRYFYDPPEFQTVLKSDSPVGYHIGYVRDSPNEPPVFLAQNSVNVDGTFTEMGDNIFSAVSLYLENLKKEGDPFKKMHVSRLQALLKEEACKLKLHLLQQTTRMKHRDSKIVTRTFNKLGLVVPYNRKTQVGYRELTLSNKELKKLLGKLGQATPEQKDKLLAELQPVLTYASIATDECDFGTGLELGLNILCSGIQSLNSTARRFLATSYRLLQRDAFALIAEAHLQNRKKGVNLSIL